MELDILDRCVRGKGIEGEAVVAVLEQGDEGVLHVVIDAGDDGLSFRRRSGEGKLDEKGASVVIEEPVNAPEQSA